MTRRKAAPGTLHVRQRIARVARSITNASPKLFAMKTTLRLSGEMSARSPNCVNTSTFAGRLSSGLSVRLAPGRARASRRASAAATARTAAYSRWARLGWWPGTNMSGHLRSSLFCISRG